MKQGLDTNVLVYAHIASFAEHTSVRRFLLARLNHPGLTIALTPAVLHEFVHIVTDPRRFAPPLEMAEALALARGYLDRSNVSLLATDAAATRRALAMMEEFRLGRKRLADTLFAATLIENGVHELITCNGDDYRIFDELGSIDPLAKTPTAPARRQ